MDGTIYIFLGFVGLLTYLISLMLIVHFKIFTMWNEKWIYKRIPLLSSALLSILYISVDSFKLLHKVLHEHGSLLFGFYILVIIASIGFGVSSVKKISIRWISLPLAGALLIPFSGTIISFNKYEMSYQLLMMSIVVGILAFMMFFISYQNSLLPLIRFHKILDRKDEI